MLSAALAYLVFALVAMVGPGVAVQRLLRLRADPAVVLPLGIVLASGLYWLGLLLGWPWVFSAGLAVLDLSLLLVRGPSGRAGHGPSLRGALPALLTVIALFALTQYRFNHRDGTGAFLLDPLVTWDTALHVGLARELALAYPAQVPALAGVPLSYHFGADLLRAAALRWAGVDPYDSISRFDLTLLALALLLGLRGLAHRLGAAPLAVALAGFSLLATDFSFLFALHPKAHWWADELRGNLLLSLALGNPVVPALALALGCLIALSRHEANEGRGWLLLAALLAFATPFFKVFTGAHLLGGLLVAAALAPRRGPVLLTAIAPLVGTAAMALGPAGARVTVGLDPLDLVRASREGLGLAPLEGLPLVAWAAFWLAASMGLRLLGVAPAFRALRSGHATGVAAAAIALSAWPLGMLLRVAADALPGDPVINNANFFIEQGGLFLWIFAAMTVARLAEGRHRVVVAAAGALALPATLQFAIVKARLAPDRLPAAMVRAMDALERASRPGDVVLQRPGARYPPAPVILIGRRVPFERYSPFLAQFAPPDALLRRRETVGRFFHTKDPAEALSIARSLGASHLCLYEEDRVRFETAGLLVPIHEEDDARCYRISGGAPR